MLLDAAPEAGTASGTGTVSGDAERCPYAIDIVAAIATNHTPAAFPARDLVVTTVPPPYGRNGSPVQQIVKSFYKLRKCILAHYVGYEYRNERLSSWPERVTAGLSVADCEKRGWIKRVPAEEGQAAL